MAGEVTAEAVTSTGKGRATYRPATYEEIVADSAAAILKAVNAGLTRLEVDFPSVSGDSASLLLRVFSEYKQDKFLPVGFLL